MPVRTKLSSRVLDEKDRKILMIFLAFLLMFLKGLYSTFYILTTPVTDIEYISLTSGIDAIILMFLFLSTLYPKR